MLCQQPIPINFTALRQNLNKKHVFEDVVRQCIDAIRSTPSLVDRDKECRSLLQRAVVILKTRCSDRETALWRAGLDLVRAAIDGCTDVAYSRQLKEYEGQCLEVLGAMSSNEDNGMLDEGPQPSQTLGLFEGQLTQGQQDPPQSLTSILAQAFGGLASDLQGAPSSEGSEDYSQPGLLQQSAIDSLLVRIMEESEAQAPSKVPPPASKSYLDSLCRRVVTEEEEAQCPICIMSLRVGDTVLTLPCSHWSHEECLIKWLETTNTCPQCRNELPTDDTAYERKKEKQKEEEEDRRGAENAVSHNEFLYI